MGSFSTWRKLRVWWRSLRRGEGWRGQIQYVFREYAESLDLALVLAFIFRIFVVSTYRIPTDNMSPTLKMGDLVLAYKLPFGVRVPFTENKVGAKPPERGTVVTFRCPGEAVRTCVKRIVGLPGDRIELSGGRLLINGQEAGYRQMDNEKQPLGYADLFEQV
jgi:signal peptidase I